MEQKESAAPNVIGKPGAWKCKAVELQMEKFEKQNRRRMRRLENMKRHAEKEAEKKMMTEKMWNNESKRRENAYRRLQRKREMEKERKRAAYSKRKEEKIADEQAATKNNHAFLEKQKTMREGREEKLRLRMEKTRHLKAKRAREKHQKRQQRIRDVRFAEEQKQADLRQRWATKEQRAGIFQEQERKKRKVAKIARDLIMQAKHNRILQAKKETLDGRRRKTAAKLKNFTKRRRSSKISSTQPTKNSRSSRALSG